MKKNKNKEIDLTFRAATMEDAKLLFTWRNDPETRRQSINTGEITLEDHFNWLGKSLINPDRKIMICYSGEEPVGMVRLDTEEPYSELSWSVAPSARGKGIGTKMISKAIELFGQPLRAKIKPGNIPSLKLAENNGFKKVKEDSEITEWILNR